MRAGYPRFFIPLVVRDLSNKLLGWAARRHTSDPSNTKISSLISNPDQTSLLVPRKWMAKRCQDFLGDSQLGTIVLEFSLSGECQIVKDFHPTCFGLDQDTVYMIVFHEDLMPKAKSFWQHTGLGISTRCAAYWLENAPFLRMRRKNSVPTILPSEEAEEANFTLRQRISDLLCTDDDPIGLEDVYLYPSGMSAIYHAAAAIHGTQGSHGADHKVAIFG